MMILYMSELFESRFKTLIKSLNQCQYEFPEELHEHLHLSLINAGYDQVPASTSITSKSITSEKQTKSRQSKLNGYHVFIKEKMPEVKADATIPATGRM